MHSRYTYQSALGWFALGNFVEAFNELDNLPPEHRASLEAMELRCRIYRKLERWQELEDVAAGCFEASNGEVLFLCYWTWAVLKQGDAVEAEAILDRYGDYRGKKSPEFCYTVACVLAALGKGDPIIWLLEAFRLSKDTDALKLRALDEPMLEKVWRDEGGRKI